MSDRLKECVTSRQQKKKTKDETNAKIYKHITTMVSRIPKEKIVKFTPCKDIIPLEK